MEHQYLKALYDDIVLMMQPLVVKRPDIAKANETVDTIRAYEQYEACITGSATIYDFTLDRKTLSKYVPTDKVGLYIKDPASIPADIKTQMLNDLMEDTVANYVERNEYYRMLNGLPELEDGPSDFVYVRDMVDQGIPVDVPVHKMTIEQIDMLDISGRLDKLKKEYPRKYYLNYVGLDSIDWLTARRAKPFEILRLGVPYNMANREIFMGEYYSARRYVLATLYNNKMFYNSPYYDATIGIIMLTLAARNMMIPTEAMYLSYEEIIDLILDSYGVLPYFQKMPFSYKRRLALAMDKLLAIKGTDQVIVDLCNLFAYDNLVANRYYIAKIPVRDENGNIKIVTKEDGSLDYDAMYELKFIKSDISSKDIDFNPENYIDYGTLTLGDPLWQLTPEEESDFKADDYNVMLSKYISVEAAYELSDLTYEVNYFVNLLLENKNSMYNLRISNMYSSTGYSTAYTMLIFLLAAFARRAGYDGNIVYDPEGIADVYGLDVDNLEETARTIIEDIVDVGNPYTHKGVNTGDLSTDTLFQTRGRLLQFNYNPDVTEMKKILEQYEIEDIDPNSLIPRKPVGSLTSDQFVDVYLTNTKIYRYIQYEMQNTSSIKRYEALSQLKKIIFTSTYTARNFMKSDGTLAETYLDMLKDLDPRLGRKIEEVPDEEVDNLLLYIMEKMESIFDSDELKHLFINTPNTSGALISKYLRNAIEIFKASSVEFSTINVVFDYGDQDPTRVIDHNILWIKKVVNEDVIIDDEISFHKYMVLDDYANTEPKIYIQ